MTKKFKLTLVIFSVLLYSELSAQNVYFTGVGRALVTNDELIDKTNTASKLKASAGYTMFDLGINAKSNEVLRGGVILRTRNEFGGFYGDGSTLQFRQMLLEGLIAKNVKYEIGDIYLKHTRYTVWNEEFMDTKYESNLFSLRRDIVNYENFYVGNAWRVQGINAKSKINFSKGIESIGVRAYGGRTRRTNFLTVPDRFFYGGRLELTQSKYFKIAANATSISDMAGTVEDSEVDYDNIVYTSDFEFKLDNNANFGFALNGEFGSSKFQLSRDIDSSKNKFEDFFYDFGVEGTYKPWNLEVGASYRDVGFNFNSPMAQTRRMAAPSSLALYTFPNMNDGISQRQFTLFDAYSTESGLYNQSISTTLMNYFVQYNMVEPYGRATPNRKGFTFNAEIAPAEKLFTANIEANLLSETVPEGDSVTLEKRKLTLIRGGLVFNINKLIGFEKLIALNAGIRTEQSARVGTNPINLTSSLLDLGVDIEVIKDLHVLGGAKLFTVKGTEVQTGRDELNQIVSYGPSLVFNQTQNVVATGLRYDYGTAGYFGLNYHIVKNFDKTTTLNDFNLNQWFFVFGLKF